MTTTTHAPRLTLEAQVRRQTGGRHVQTLRRTGKLPGVVYGLAGANVPIEFSAAHAAHIVHSGSHLVDLKIDDKVEHVLIQQVQYDFLQASIAHVDFLRIDPSRKVKVKVPLDFRGTPKGAKEGGILEKQIAEVDVETLPLEIPDVIRINVEHLELHGILHAKEIPLPAGARLLNPPDQIVCQVRTVKEEIPVAEAEGGPTEPEVIGRKAAEEEVEGQAAAPSGKQVAAAGKQAAAPAGKQAAPAKK